MTIVPSGELCFEQLHGRASADPLRDIDAASSLRVVLLDQAESRYAHRHPHTEEIVYVRTGRATAFVDGTPHRIGPGDVMHIPAGVPHATIPEHGERVELICFFPHPDLSQNLEATDIQLTIEEQP